MRTSLTVEDCSVKVLYCQRCALLCLKAPRLGKFFVWEQ